MSVFLGSLLPNIVFREAEVIAYDVHAVPPAGAHDDEEFHDVADASLAEASVEHFSAAVKAISDD